MFNKILVAVDGSPSSRKAVEMAMELAGKFGSRLYALSVVRLPDYAATVGEVTEAQAEGKNFYAGPMREIEREAKEKGIPAGTKILYGHPAEVILDYAKQEGIDLIVMGRNGTANVRRFLLGSVSDRVAHHSEIPLLIVK
ncbi:hypothetical protein SY88_20350 [Clostridiales bacterium PH28_bin88]|nr:hypothetical protein SY88_20350 [Clostridiales bacterium PH28_bin88]